MQPIARGPLTVAELTARATLIAAPILGFAGLPFTGLLSLAMLLPASVLVMSYLTTTENRRPTWELALIALLALSVLWGDLPNYSAERLRTYLVLLVATVVASALLDRAAILSCLRVAFVVLIGIGLVRILLLPSTRVRGDATELVLTGGYSKNTFGGLLAIALLLVVERTRRRNLVLIPLLVVLLALNRSATAWVVATFLTIATIACRVVTARRGPREAGAVLGVLGIVGVGGSVLLAFQNVDSAVGALGKDSTLGRRTEIWQACWTQIQEAPLLGHGAFTFLNGESRSPVTEFVWARFQNYEPPHPHNGLLDLSGQLGLAGVIVFAGMVGTALWRAWPGLIAGSRDARTAAVVLSFIVLFGVTEPTYLGPWLMITFMCVAATSLHRPPSRTQVRLPAMTRQS